MEQNFYTYKGYPLVRNKNTIYYGYMSDPFVIMMHQDFSLGHHKGNQHNH